MERNANYALVGLTSTLLVIGMVVFSVWLAAYKFNQDYDYYDIVFAGPVRGLSQGGEVHFNGIKVGEVTGISLDTVDPTQVIARAKVTSDVPIRVDSFATLEPQGITGVNYVQITAGTPANRLLKRAVPKGTVPRIRSERGMLSDLLASGGNVLARAVEALDRVNRVLSEDNIKRSAACWTMSRPRPRSCANARPSLPTHSARCRARTERRSRSANSLRRATPWSKAMAVRSWPSWVTQPPTSRPQPGICAR